MARTMKLWHVMAVLFAGCMLAVPSIATGAGPGDESMSLIPEQFCIRDVAGQVVIDIRLSDIKLNHPIKAANINLEWQPNLCWEVIDIVPGPGFDQFGTEDTGPGFIRYSVTRAVGQPGITTPQAIAQVIFRSLAAADDCCVEEIALTPGSGASATKVTGDAGYVNIPNLGEAKQIRIDALRPTIIPISDMTVSTLPGLCHWRPGGTEPDIILPTATDNCDDCDCVVTWARSDGKAGLNEDFAVGDVFITWTATDCCGNLASQIQRIRVRDTEPPRIDPPEGVYTVAADENCEWVLEVNTPFLTITDNCTPDPNVMVTPPAGTVWGLGTHDFVVAANDSHFNNVVAMYTLIVADQTPPEFTMAPSDMEVYADAGRCAAAVEWQVAARDQCDSAIMIGCQPMPGTDFAADASHNVACHATDAAGNIREHNFVVNVLPFWKVNVDVQMKGFVSHQPFVRCTELELSDCTGVLPPAALPGELRFVNGLAIGEFLVPLPVLCAVEGTYTCARAKEVLHSLWSEVSSPDKLFIDPTGKAFQAKFLSEDALRLGDLNNDTFVDIVDWIIWQYQFLNPAVVPPPSATPCNPLPDPTDPAQQNADVSGDRRVTAIDYGHLYLNNFAEDDADCCATLAMAARGPRSRVSLDQLVSMNMGYAVAFDHNHDGFVDSADLRAVMSQSREVTPPRASDSRASGR